MQGSHFPPRIISDGISENGQFEKFIAKDDINEECALNAEKAIPLPVMELPTVLEEGLATLTHTICKNAFFNDNFKHEFRAKELQRQFKKPEDIDIRIELPYSSSEDLKTLGDNIKTYCLEMCNHEDVGL